MLPPVLTKNDKKARTLILVFSAIVFIAIVALGRVKLNVDLGFDEHVFAFINSIINSIVAVLLVAALVAVKTKHYFIDVHQLQPGKVKYADVAEAHKKDLAVQGKYGVNLINYWVNEKEGVIMCLAEAKDSTSLIRTHKEAHGLVPAKVMKVKQGE